jgi:hypothetical protein
MKIHILIAITSLFAGCSMTPAQNLLFGSTGEIIDATAYVLDEAKTSKTPRPKTHATVEYEFCEITGRMEEKGKVDCSTSIVPKQ